MSLLKLKNQIIEIIIGIIALIVTMFICAAIMALKTNKRIKDLEKEIQILKKEIYVSNDNCVI